MAYATHTTRIDTGLSARIHALRAAFADWRARRAAYLQSYRELDALSPRELDDLGIRRADIDAIARESARF